MRAFDILGDPVRRRILELLADGERTAGQVGAVIQEEFGISQPAVSQHLRVLRENGLVTVLAEGTRRLYAVSPSPLKDVDLWLDRYRKFWSRRLDSLGTELTRGSHESHVDPEHPEESTRTLPGTERTAQPNPEGEA